MWITQLISLGNPCISCRNRARPHRLTHAVFRGFGKRHHHSPAFRFYPTPVDNVKHPLHVAVFVPLHLPVIAPDRYHADRCANTASVHSALPVDKNSVAKAPEPRPLRPPSRIQCSPAIQALVGATGPPLSALCLHNTPPRSTPVANVAPPLPGYRAPPALSHG
jgi:hypothetical protein